MLGDRRFFLEKGLVDCNELIDAVYEVARFHRIDPEVEMTRPLSIVVEHFDQAQRLVRLERGADPE